MNGHLVLQAESLSWGDFVILNSMFSAGTTEITSVNTYRNEQLQSCYNKKSNNRGLVN